MIQYSYMVSDMLFKLISLPETIKNEEWMNEELTRF